MSEKLDFVQTMKDWRRMCNYYSDASMKDGQHSCVDMCPLGHNTACGDIETATDRDIEDAAKAIEKWAEDHPKPRYPTWMEWLQGIGAFNSCICEVPDCIGAPVTEEELNVWYYVAISLFSEIPAQTAQALGIEPKPQV